jgi:hypothetical protein
MLKQIDRMRLAMIKQDLALLNLRFPISTLVKRTGLDKGNISKMLSGIEPCSDSFFDRFYAAFQDKLIALASKNAPIPIDKHLNLVISGTTQSEQLKAIASTLSQLAVIVNNLV